jgi:hypothetical protein
MIGLEQPAESRVQLEYTLVSKSVQRRHPSHYALEGSGKIYVHPRLPQTKLVLPDAAREPKIVGDFHFWIVQMFQAFADHIEFPVMLSEELSPILGLFSKAQGMEGQFREDLPIEACNNLAVMDRFTINDPTYDHETLKRNCIEEFVRVFCHIEIVALHFEGVKLAQETLKKMRFARVSETDFLIRDNCVHFGGPLVDPPKSQSSNGIMGIILGNGPPPG